MPDFSTPFAGNKFDRKLTKKELIRAVRFSIASEYEAIQLYEQLKDSIDDEHAKKLLQEVAEDEKIHVGNFLKLLSILAPDEKKFYEEGFKEAVDIMELS
jgi:rubrerythrin